MNKPSPRLSGEYTATLRNYMAGEGEEGLQAAYELGRRAVSEGLGVLDVARIHQEASVALLLPTIAQSESKRQIQSVENFLMEALSPFEAHHRGFRVQ